MAQLLSILWMPFVACIVLAGILCYFGIHVVMREVIFVDLALAQVAVLGTLLPLFWAEEHSWQVLAFSLVFVVAGAALFSFARFRRRKIPQEAIIGIVYVVASALSVLILDRNPHGQEKIEEMLVGNILTVGWSDLLWLLGVAVVVGAVHGVLRNRFIAISASYADVSGVRPRLWDFLFYATFGLIVTQAVAISGVLMVFSFLIVPAVVAMMFANGFLMRLLVAWGFAVVASAAGLGLSGSADFPVGASVVSCFGGLLIVAVVVYGIAHRRG